MSTKDQLKWAALIVGAVVLFNYLQPTHVSTSGGDPSGSNAGPGADPFDEGDYSVATNMVNGGL